MPKRKPSLVLATQHATFECGCGAVHHSLGQGLPIGWSATRGQAWCQDCTTSGVPARELNAPKPRQQQAA